ncbi:hypothetical protein EVAR_70901_1 [Eumeta japonica]|uniref:Uncharacterized protein n=1 Tax=Eumeta variegata TaxID=151549 RepID=A0A4C2ACE9_EUMVA|nr:hypothetical protein EVAR_70901_1 [Eumeta japonica]
MRGCNISPTAALAERTARLAAPLTPGSWRSALAAGAVRALHRLRSPIARRPPAPQAWDVDAGGRCPGVARAGGRPARAALDLSACDGLRVVCMLCVIVEHVCWLAVTAYVATPASPKR